MRYIVMAVLLSAVWTGAAPGLSVEVQYGQRLIHEGWSPPLADFQEGGVVATFVADAPVDTAVAMAGLERLDAER
jgi:hypothetical protein